MRFRSSRILLLLGVLCLLCWFPSCTGNNEGQNDGGVKEGVPEGNAKEEGSTETPSGCSPATESATYKVTFEAVWSANTHPHEFPSNPHFSGLIGATHHSGFVMWAPGQKASAGVKSMAETGSKDPLNAEIDAAVTQGTAGVKISGGGISTSPGTVSVDFTIKSGFPLVSITSMIAPSPDWFVGVHGLSLCEDNKWVAQKKMDLLAYDAGTDSGASYTAANQQTDPAEAITQLQSQHAVNNGTPIVFGTFTFVKQ